MSIHIPTPTIHVYKELNKGKYKITQHYKIVEVKNGVSKLSELLNISKNRNFAQSTPEFWLKIKQGKKWSNYITGLFKIHLKDIYKGDVNKRKHLLIFKFNDKANILVVYYFNNYFTNDLSKVLPLID